MVTLSDKNQQKISNIFSCKICDYNTDKKFNYIKHLDSIKHNVTKCDAAEKKSAKNQQSEKKYVCENCEKTYSSRNGLWVHKKKCNTKNTNENTNIASNIVITPEIIIDIIKTHSNDIKQIILEQNNSYQNTIQTLVTNGINNINGNNVNSHNKSFNLQFFLNETCKNAMNIMDFANSIKVQLTDLEKIGELGYVDGISKIIVDNLKLLDVTERPVHCSDLKRESLYVKNNDQWEKENENNVNMNKLINSVANKNIPLIQEWKKKYPESNKCDSVRSTQINKMIMEVMETDNLKKEKIVKKIAKEVVIEKER